MGSRININVFSLTFATFAEAFAYFAVKRVLLLVFFVNPYLLFAQETKLSDIITSVVEELAAEETDPEYIEMYIEKLSDLAESPVNLNSADENELSRLFFLTPFQIKALADYSHSAGTILSVYEIANIPGFNRQATEMIIPFITLEQQPSTSKKTESRLRNTILSNITYSSTNEDTTCPGSPVRILTRYKFSSAAFSGGFTAEKDPGENFLSDNNSLPDFLSAYLEYTGNGFIRKIIIGDFSARFGEGTCINTGFRPGLFLTSPGYMSSKSEVRQYTSADENNYLRGVAASFAIKNLSWTIFYSQNKIDATLNDAGDRVTNLYTAGLHNKPSLMLRKDALTDISYGINLTYNFRNIRMGTVWTEDRLSIPFELTSGDPEDAFGFTGARNSLYSFYYNSVLGRVLLFGEITFNESLKHALVQGVSIRLSDRLAVNALLRDYENGYFSFHGKGPGSSGWNERSVLGNFTFEAAKHLFISAGCDLRHFPWLKYRCSAPTYAVRQEIRVKYLPAGNISMEALYNYRFSMNDNVDDKGIPSQEELISHYARGSFRYSPLERLTFTIRLDYKTVAPAGEKGALLSQDLSYSLSGIPLTFWFRYCLYNTGGWDSRLYAYENDLLYSFSIPALSGTGSRSYAMVKYEVGNIADIRVKYGITTKRTILSDSDDKQDIRFQVRLFF